MSSSRSVTLPLVVWLTAAAALRRLNSTEGQPSGLPLPPFTSQLRLGAALRTVASIELDHTTQRTRLEASHALREPDGSLKPVFDANGNRLNAQYYLDDVAAVNADVSAMHMTDITKLIDLSLDDFVYCGARRMPDVLSALMPLLDESPMLSDEATDWLITYDAALMKAAARMVPAHATAVPETTPGA